MIQMLTSTRPTGGATVTAPAAWNHPNLKAYYGLRPPSTVRAATRAIPSTSVSPSPSSSATPKSGKTNIAAIAGGTVGGLVVLIGILCLILFCLHRRKKANKNGGQGAPAPSPAELAVTPIPHEMSTPEPNKYMSVDERPGPNIHMAYSAIAPLHSRSPSHDYTSAYSAQTPPSYGSAPTFAAGTYHPSDEGAYTRVSQQSPTLQNNTELFFPDDGTTRNSQAASWGQNGNIQQNAASQRHYSYPTPTSPLQQSSIPASSQGQPQIYYPPPQDPRTYSQGSQPSFSQQRGSPTGTQHSGGTPQGHTPNMSTMNTPAQFYPQPAPVRPSGGSN